MMDIHSVTISVTQKAVLVKIAIHAQQDTLPQQEEQFALNVTA